MKAMLLLKLYLDFEPEIEKKNHCGNIKRRMMLKYRNITNM